MISKAPARVCLFGDHQDYLGLPVIACAINKYIVVEGVPNNTNCLTFNLTDLGQIVKIDLDEDFSSLKKATLLSGFFYSIHGICTDATVAVVNNPDIYM